MSELSKAVIEHATEHYQSGVGWDMVVECLTADEIDKILAAEGITTERAAIAYFENDAALWVAQQENCRYE